MSAESSIRTVVVTSRDGLTLAPCYTIAKTVVRHQARVTVQKDTVSADAENLLALLCLGATHGTKLVVSAAGPEREQVLEALSQLFNSEIGAT
jgi:phosphotransferase system HPr (HPr) family protein